MRPIGKAEKFSEMHHRLWHGNGIKMPRLNGSATEQIRRPHSRNEIRSFLAIRFDLFKDGFEVQPCHQPKQDSGERHVVLGLLDIFNTCSWYEDPMRNQLIRSEPHTRTNVEDVGIL